MLKAVKYVTVAAAVSLPLISQWEGFEDEVYLDAVGVPTYCYGETENVEYRKYSHAECLERLAVRVQTGYIEPISKCAKNWEQYPLSVKASSASISYNIGTNGWCGSTMRKLFDKGKYVEGCKFMHHWNKAGGKVLRGLVNRRADEVEFCLSGLQRNV